MDDTGVYPAAQRSLLDSCVARVLLATGLAESPRSLESLVGTVSMHPLRRLMERQLGAYANRLVSWRSEEMSAYTSHPQYVSYPVPAGT